jgi:hypothetical protein
MIPKIKKIRHYKGSIEQANQKLRDITWQLDDEAFEECMKLFGLKYYRYSMGGGDWTDLEIVDSFCKKRATGVSKFSSVCLVANMPPHHYAVDATNEQLLDFFSRLDSIKAFL